MPMVEVMAAVGGWGAVAWEELSIAITKFIEARDDGGGGGVALQGCSWGRIISFSGAVPVWLASLTTHHHLVPSFSNSHQI